MDVHTLASNPGAASVAVSGPPLLALAGAGADHAIVLAVGAAVGASCGLLGAFLVLRKVAMLGDAISHAVLPGIAIAFIWTGTRSTLPMVVGAGALGVLTVFLTGALNRTRRMHEDASIGVVYPALFSIGVILVSRFASQVDLDLDCVLYGEIAYAPYDVIVVGETVLRPKALWVLLPILALDVGFVSLFYKELKVTSFDPDLAFAIGVSPALMHYLLMCAVSVTVVGSFESVGAILVVAMLIVPPATAYLLTERLWTMLLLSVGLGVLSSTGGYLVAHRLDCSIAGAMASTAGGLFVLAFLLAPGQGLLARIVSRARLSARFREQLILLHLEDGAAPVSCALLMERFRWGRRRLERAVAVLDREGLVERTADGLRLTPAGVRSIESMGTRPLAHGRR